MLTNFLTHVRENEVRIWNLTGKPFLSTIKTDLNYLDATALSADNRTLAYGSKHKIVLKDIISGRELGSLKVQADNVQALSFSPNGRLLASGDTNAIKLWNVATGRLQRVFKNSGEVGNIVVSPNGRLLVSSEGSTIKVWNIATGLKLRTLNHSDQVSAMRFSPDSKFLLSCSARGIYDNRAEIKFWDVTKGQELWVLTDRSDIQMPVIFSPDGTTFISPSADSTIKLHAAKTAQVIRAFNNRTGIISSMTFSKDGKLFISGSMEGKIRVWDVASGNELITLVSFDNNDWVAVTPEGRFDGSSGGMTQMHYVQNNKTVPLEGSFKQYYMPDLLINIFSSNIKAGS